MADARLRPQARGTDLLLDLEGFSLNYGTEAGEVRALDDVTLRIKRGSVMGLVGESGSGKSSIVLAMLGLAGRSAKVTALSALYAGRHLLSAAPSLRGRQIGLIFQDSAGALNPALRVGRQIAEPMTVHMGYSWPQALQRAEALLQEVGIPNAGSVVNAYPHQLSGGMKQRVVIAGALATEPELLLLDEPTTALDVTVEAQIIDLLDKLRMTRGLSMLFVSHNLGVISRICDELTVLYGGRVVEQGAIGDVLHRPLHPYTKGLLAALPRLDGDRKARLAPIPGRLPDLVNVTPGCNFAARCPFAVPECQEPQVLLAMSSGQAARCHRAWELHSRDWPRGADAGRIADRPPSDGAKPIIAGHDLQKRFVLPRQGRLISWTGGMPRLAARRTLSAVDHISLEVGRGEVLGVVGESGSGKSTLGRVLLRLSPADGGTVTFDGGAVPETPDLSFRRRAQIVFQSSSTSLNPRRTVDQMLRRSLARHGISGGRPIDEEIDQLLDRVRLPPAYRHRYPHQLSGGEKQRVGIARALASRPDFVVCDEAVSALDVSVQAAILNLLADLRDDLGVAYLFITHDIGVVAHIADRIAVMYRGAVVEQGPVDEVIDNPLHPYTRALISAVPRIGARDEVSQRVSTVRPAVSTSEQACRFADRCTSHLGTSCETILPPFHELKDGHRAACHLLGPMPRRTASASLPDAVGQPQ